jgi:thioredoxin reductase (NADPH)
MAMNDADGMIRLIGKRGCARAYAIRDFLYRNGMPFEWIELADDEQARRQAGVSGVNDDRLPICAFPDGTELEGPTVRQITEKLGWFRDPSRPEYDLSIYGAGPAGLGAAVYAASEGLKTVVVERWAVGGQASSSPRIENYPGFPQGISGADLAERAREQATRFGAELLLLREGVRGEFRPGKGVVYLADGTKIVSRASVCATGIVYRRLDLPNEDRLAGAGIYYGAGASEARLCRREYVVVVGGGNSAAQAALHFAQYAAKVLMVLRERSLTENMSLYLADRIRSTPELEVHLRTEVIALDGDRVLRAVTLRHNETGEEQSVATHWLFLCLGGVPNTEWAAEVGIIRDEAGYLVTGPDLMKDSQPPRDWPLERQPYYLETNVPGVFAAGDVRHGSVKRCTSAVGEGAMVVAFVHRYLAAA